MRGIVDADDDDVDAAAGYEELEILPAAHTTRNPEP